MDNFLKKLEIIKKLGEGSSSDVYLVKNTDTLIYYSFRITCITSKRNTEDVISSLENHKRLGKHKYILELYEWFQFEDKIYQLIEYGYGMDIYDYMKEFKFKSLPENFVKYIIKRVVKGLVYIHSNHIIHGDIKIENILIDPGTKSIKIIDFDLSFDRIKCPVRTRLSGTLDFLAPEILSKIPYSYPVDIWALGVVCYELIEGISPFKRESDRDTMIAILCDDRIMNCTKLMSTEAKQFTNTLLNRVPYDRPSAIDILQSADWLKAVDIMELN